MSVWVARLICPSQHCIIGNVGEFEHLEETLPMVKLLQQQFDELVAANVIDPWCVNCKSRNLFFMIERTQFATVAEAQAQLQAEQTALRTQMEAIKRSQNN